MKNILILQKDQEDASPLVKYFQQREANVKNVSKVGEAFHALNESSYDLVFIDIHTPESAFTELITYILKNFPKAGLICTSQLPDTAREQQAVQAGAGIFLRAPFSNYWIETKVKRASHPLEKGQIENLQRVSFPLRLKITSPYVLLSLIFAVIGAVISSQLIFENIERRFENELVISGQISRDLMVTIENEMLEDLRQLAFTEGLAESLLAEDSERLREITLPIAANNALEHVHLLNMDGVSVLSLRRAYGSSVVDFTSDRGDTQISNWPFVQITLNQAVDVNNNTLSNKFSGWEAPFQDQYYFYVSSPVYSEEGEFAGAIVLGESFEQLIDEFKREADSDVVTFYSLDGLPLRSSSPLFTDNINLEMDMANAVITLSGDFSVIRNFNAGSLEFSEVLGSWESRNGQLLGILGVSKARNLLISTSSISLRLIFLSALALLIMVIGIGLFIASRITQPLFNMIQAVRQVESGDLDLRIESTGNDEISALARSINSMILGLREGFLYRDLLGRTISPEVRDALRTQLSHGDLKFSGQNVFATVLLTDIRNFSSISEQQSPEDMMGWLNDYFGLLSPQIINENGIINKYIGDAVLAFFGVFPEILDPTQAALHACLTAEQILTLLTKYNQERKAENLPPFYTGVSLHAGEVTAGVLGASERLEYTLIGETVNAVTRIDEIAKTFQDDTVLVSSVVVEALGEHRSRFELESLGEYSLRGFVEPMPLFRLHEQNGT